MGPIFVSIMYILHCWFMSLSTELLMPHTLEHYMRHFFVIFAYAMGTKSALIQDNILENSQLLWAACLASDEWHILEWIFAFEIELLKPPLNEDIGPRSAKYFPASVRFIKIRFTSGSRSMARTGFASVRRIQIVIPFFSLEKNKKSPSAAMQGRLLWTGTIFHRQSCRSWDRQLERREPLEDTIEF